MPFGFFKKLAAPSVFNKGIQQYNQQQYNIALQLFDKAYQWMPSLDTHPLHQALVRLCRHHLGRKVSNDEFNASLEAMTASPQKDTEDYAAAIQKIKNILDQPS